MDRKRLEMIGVAAAAVAIGGFVYYRLASKKPPATSLGVPKGAIEVTQLWVYPVKSCGGMPLQKAKLNQFGVEYDREWVIVDRATNKVQTQREISKMKLIFAAIDEVNGALVLSAQGAGSCKVPLKLQKAPEDKLLRLEKWDLFGMFQAESEEVAQWLTAYLGKDVFLARCVGARNPNDNAKYRPLLKPDMRVNGQDFSTLHIVTEEALAWIRKEANDASINVARFRPNIVVAGAPFPAEDDWHQMTMYSMNGTNQATGAISLVTAKPCSRCSIPTIDDEAKANKDYQPTKTIREKHATGTAVEPERMQPMFGLNVFHLNLGEISIGDVLKVESTRPAPKAATA